MSRKFLLRPTALWPQSLHTQIFFCLTYIISMARIRNMHSLIGSRTFFYPHMNSFYVLFGQGCKKWGNGQFDKVSKNQTMAET
jgi:hypothetical protein